MDKKRAPSSARKPPEETTTHAGIDEWMRRRVMPDLQPIVRALDATIREALDPGLLYAIKWKRAYYGLPELGWIIELAPYDVSVNIVFLGGADFDDPPSLGSTDRSRYVKLTTLEQTETPEMRAWIEEAGRVPGWT
jgi:hypothetical protein